MHHVDHFEAACSCVLINMPLFRINMQHEHFEASEALDGQSGAIELFVVAHDLLEHIGATSLIEQILAFPRRC